MHRSQIFFLILVSTLISITAGLYNNFPITYPDTAAYLASGIDNYVPVDRPIFYGMFLRFTHLMDDLMLSIIAQGILASISIYLLFKYFSPIRNKQMHFLLSVLLLTCFTGYSFFVSFLMPDIFTALLFISIALLVFAPLSLRDNVFVGMVCLFSTIVHNAHFPLVLLMLLILSIKFFANRKTSAGIFWRSGLFKLFIVFIGSIGFSLLINFAKTGDVFLSRNGHVFFISRLHENQILEAFLNDKCGTHSYVLCPYKDSIPADFIWNMQSPLYKTGGFESSGPGYRTIVLDMLKDPKYLKKLLLTAFTGTLQQLGSFEIEPQHRNVLAYIGERFSAHRLTQDIAFQNRGGERRLNFDKLNFIQHILVLFSFTLTMIILVFRKWEKPVVRDLFVLLLWFLLINAFLSSFFSTVLTRYQGRIIFLLPLLLLLCSPYISWRSVFKLSEREEN